MRVSDKFEVVEMPILSAQSFEDIDRFTGSEKLVLIDFYADWCEPCVFLDEILIRLDQLYGNELIILKVDIEKITQVKSSYRILSVPVLNLFVNGKSVWRMNGFKMEDELMAIIDSFPRET